jgi:hypothetical protein
VACNTLEEKIFQFAHCMVKDSAGKLCDAPRKKKLLAVTKDTSISIAQFPVVFAACRGQQMFSCLSIYNRLRNKSFDRCTNVGDVKIKTL